MTPSLELVESRDHVIALSADSAAALSLLGRQLASSTTWWGADDNEARERTVIEIVDVGEQRWRVRIRDAIGIIVLREVQLHIVPKIPTAHFLYLAQRSEMLPRIATDRGLGASGELWEVVILWFLSAAEDLLRRGLIKDYSAVQETLSTIKGRADVQSAARRFYKGDLSFDCTFDDHVEDVAPNRLVRAAAAYASAAPVPQSIQDRARRIAQRFQGVSKPLSVDWGWTPDRRTAYYRTAVTLARHVLRSTGRDLQAGSEALWTFLIRTPELVEDGIRSVLQDALGPTAVFKRGVQLPGSSMTFNPDLRFWDTRAVADVKYKLTSGEWARAELYQVLAFAAALRCQSAALINFNSGEERASEITVGDHRVRQISWQISLADPESAAEQLTHVVREWLAS